MPQILTVGADQIAALQAQLQAQAKLMATHMQRNYQLNVELKTLMLAGQKVYQAVGTQTPAALNAPVFEAFREALGIPVGALDWPAPIENDNDVFNKRTQEVQQKLQALRNITGADITTRRQFLNALKQVVDAEVAQVAE
jgi:glycerol-3-phosphate O-acyltransferase